MTIFRNRLPPKHSITPVLAAIVFPVYGWMVLRIFHTLPSWLKYLNLQEILITSLYIFASTLFESLAILGVLLVMAFILPAKLFKEHFVAQGSLLVWLYFGLNLFLIDRLPAVSEWALREFAVNASIFLAAAGLACILICYLAVYRFQAVNRLISAVADRLTIFLYLYIPLSLLGLIVVIARNI